MSIPVLRPSITEEEIKEVKKVLESGWLGLGPKTHEFEKRFSEYIGSPFTVGLNSGTAALHLAVESLQIEEGDEIIVTPMTFISSVHAISYAGGIPVFADVDPQHMNIDVIDIERKITKRTKAIIVVHLGGHPCEMDEINALAKNYGLSVIEDAAHACGAEYKGHKIGKSDNLVCFSFHAVKNLTCGEGGAITCNNEWYDRFFREMRWVGISKDTWIRTDKSQVYAWQYWVDKLGYKYHMSDINAAIGIVQLRRLECLNAKRREIVQKYIDCLRDLPWIELPCKKDHVKCSWHLFQIKVPDKHNRDRLIDYLCDNGIATGVHYLPANLHPFYKNLKSRVPVACEIWKRILTLPLFPDLTNEETDYIIDTLRQFKPTGKC